MVLQEKTEGLDNFLQLLEKHKEKKTIIALFCGGKNSSDGVSWCPDCVSAEPIIEKGLAAAAPEDAVFIYCSVGDRTSWKDPNNAYRTHPKLQLKGVPTLLQWDTPKKLGEKDCSNADLVQMFFEED
ncbi:thioredoxin domain-containing protein 17 [Strongylocentrotus purpuratus]|uniref:Thioredoxin domain-containing protein 17 n=1 Tax=Strongylocentrotus purpuratus TaxID=7668 RepID=A0A7M7RH54_STRPU|nr:thioredoxin domain-containing protein 17 [Strongylocentrotus purpuratus]|eukprot:XP_787642.1 PREDICTED: thioredoxin domain-containing protein 17 [Strongylocentrotus purpuratus]